MRSYLSLFWFDKTSLHSHSRYVRAYYIECLEIELRFGRLVRATSYRKFVFDRVRKICKMSYLIYMNPLIINVLRFINCEITSNFCREKSFLRSPKSTVMLYLFPASCDCIMSPATCTHAPFVCTGTHRNANAAALTNRWEHFKMFFRSCKISRFLFDCVFYN